MMMLHNRTIKQKNIGRIVLVITLLILALALVAIKSCTNQPAFN